MPTYEFRCRSCKHKFEVTRDMAHCDDWAPCPKCGVGTTRRILSLTNVVIDGSDPTFPRAAMKWEKDRYRRATQERKEEKEHGPQT